MCDGISSWIQTLLHFFMIWEGLEQGLAKLPHLRDSSELYTTIGFSIGEEIVYETKIYRKCSVICNKRNCFTCTALRETTSNIPLSVTHFSEWFLCYTPVVVSLLLLLSFCHLLTFVDDFFVIALCLYFSPFSSFLSLTHFSEYFLCYELQDHRRWNDYSNLTFMEADDWLVQFIKPSFSAR